jgi:hypothetical protein
LTGHARAETYKESNQEEIRIHYLTDCQIGPLLEYDVLCFLNTLTADLFYLRHYKPEYEELEKALKTPVKKALAKLKKNKRREAMHPFCLFLSLFLSR